MVPSKPHAHAFAGKMPDVKRFAMSAAIAVSTVAPALIMHAVTGDTTSLLDLLLLGLLIGCSVALLTLRHTYDVAVKPRIAEVQEALREKFAIEESRATLIEAQKDQAKALAETQSELELLSDMIDRVAFISETDVRGVILRVNDNFCRQSGYSREELVGASHAKLNSGLHPRRFWKDMYSKMAKGEVWVGEVRNRTKTGEHYWVKCFNTARRDAQGRTTGYLSVRIDISEIKEQQIQLRTRKLRLDAALNAIGKGLIMYDADNRLAVSNRTFAEVFEIPADLAAPGTPVEAILAHRAATGNMPGLMSPNDSETAARTLIQRVAKKEMFTEQVRLRDGRQILTRYRPLPAGGWVETHEDVTERLEKDERIAYLAHNDSLTGLPNRVALTEHLETALRDADERPLAVHLIDLDGFKDVNDTLGHSAGDEVLRIVAKKLCTTLGRARFVARLGGDEFAVIERLDGDEDGSATARQILDLVNNPIDIGEHQSLLGASIGIARATRDGTTSDMLLKHADLALYQSKHQGKHRFSFYHAALSQAMEARYVIEHDLRQALARNEFFLVYQGIFNPKTRALTGFEALLRWRHPSRGLVPPLDFIPIAEETGQITAIGAWVLRKACEDARNWPKHVKIAVNVSPRQLREPRFASDLVLTLAETGLSPTRLEIEITEGVLADGSEVIRRNLLEVHKLGIRLAIDDFGTGYSSMSYLRRFPVDKIKIDRSFIKDTERDATSASIVRGILDLGRSIGAVVCAEGVETDAQLSLLQEIGCHEAQGFLLSKPAEQAALHMTPEPQEIEAEAVLKAAT